MTTRRAAVLAAMLGSLAAAQLPVAVSVGALPPSAFALQSIDGETFDLAAARGQQPLVVLFFRGTW